MSIIYNNQVVAGKYTQQVVADADTVNAGIIKLATEEQVIEGVDNTTAITPFYLAQKQDKISAGDGIVIDNNEISCTVNPDEQTIVRKDNGTMQCIGQLTKSNTLKFDWEGTQAEYNVAYLNGTIQPDWYCYITDDEEFVDYGDIANQSLSNLKAEGEARFTAKANTDLDNLSSVGQGKLDIKADKATTLNGYGITDGLNKNQITNCLLEVPQNIKLELADGVLTLKAGSKVVVPNGVGVFDEVVIAQDINYPTLSHATIPDRAVFLNASKNGLVGLTTVDTSSGATQPSSPRQSHIWYDTTNNIVKQSSDTGSTWTTGLSLPICIGNYVKDSGFTSIDQVFNGIGYIGSTVWVDKGVKGLIPNGRNEDGTLRNVEWENDVFRVRNYTSANKSVIVSLRHPQDIYYNDYPLSITETSAISQDEYMPSGSASYLTEENIWRGHASSDYYNMFWMLIGSFQTNASGVISNFQPKLPFRAIDYNDKPEISGWAMPSSKYIDLTLGASGTNYTAPANGWYYLGRCATANGQFIDMYNTTSNYRFQTQSVGTAYCLITIPAKKGDIVKINYTVNGDLNGFKFIYAQGEL